MTPTRSYVSPTRDEQAAATLARIVQSAAVLFSTRGYALTSVGDIAARAGVSSKSVHLVGTKVELLFLAIQEVFAKSMDWRSGLTDGPLGLLLDRADASVLIDRLSGFVTVGNVRSAGIRRAIRVAAESDDRVAAVLERSRKDYLGFFHEIAQRLADRGLVPADLDAREVGDDLFALASTDTFTYLTEECGWTRGRYRTWLSTSVKRMLAEPATGSVLS